MFPGSVKSVNYEVLCHPMILLIFLQSGLTYNHVYVVKEYERVVGWEGSNAVSPPRDGAALGPQNYYNIYEGLRALQRCPCSYSNLSVVAYTADY